MNLLDVLFKLRIAPVLALQDLQIVPDVQVEAYDHAPTALAGNVYISDVFAEGKTAHANHEDDCRGDSNLSALRRDAWNLVAPGAFAGLTVPLSLV